MLQRGVAGGRRGMRAGCLAVLALFACLRAVPALALSPEEAKAAFVFNFAKFTDWPAGSFKDNQSALNVCVVNASSQEASAFGSLNGKPAKNRELRVRTLKSGEALAGCHIAFLANASAAAAAESVRPLRGQAVLSIADVAGAAESGVIIGLVPADNKLQIVINMEILTASHLTLSSQVLQLARIVKETVR